MRLWGGRARDRPQAPSRAHEPRPARKVPCPRPSRPASAGGGAGDRLRGHRLERDRAASGTFRPAGGFHVGREPGVVWRGGSVPAEPPRGLACPPIGWGGGGGSRGLLVRGCLPGPRRHLKGQGAAKSRGEAALWPLPSAAGTSADGGARALPTADAAHLPQPGGPSPPPAGRGAGAPARGQGLRRTR